MTILDLIDNALHDCVVSGDAMRWAPKAEPAECARHPEIPDWERELLEEQVRRDEAVAVAMERVNAMIKETYAASMAALRPAFAQIIQAAAPLVAFVENERRRREQQRPALRRMHTAYSHRARARRRRRR